MANNPLRTLVFLIKNNEIGLAEKRLNFGKGKYNGYGGKVEDETVEEAAIRELHEESSLIAQISDLDKKGEVEFCFPDKPEFSQIVHIYFLYKYQGDPKPSEEMGPLQWFTFDALPLDKMWSADGDLLQKIFDTGYIRAKVTFAGEGEFVKQIDYR